jgi:ABC-type spermidine/putrescine transport system permease subunit II
MKKLARALLISIFALPLFAFPVYAVTENKEGGTWNWGITLSGSTLSSYSNYLHPSYCHSATTKIGSKVSYSIKVKGTVAATSTSVVGAAVTSGSVSAAKYPSIQSSMCN